MILFRTCLSSATGDRTDLFLPSPLVTGAGVPFCLPVLVGDLFIDELVRLPFLAGGGPLVSGEHHFQYWGWIFISRRFSIRDFGRRGHAKVLGDSGKEEQG